MAFDGHYIKVNGTTFPNGLLAKDGGYACTPNQRTDKDSYVDGTGALHRTILPVQRSTVKIKTVDDLPYSQKVIIQTFFVPRDVVTMEYWNDETNTYETTRFYVPDIEYVHKYQVKGMPHYNSLEITFIAYEGDQ